MMTLWVAVLCIAVIYHYERKEMIRNEQRIS